MAQTVLLLCPKNPQAICNQTNTSALFNSTHLALCPSHSRLPATDPVDQHNPFTLSRPTTLAQGRRRSENRCFNSLTNLLPPSLQSASTQLPPAPSQQREPLLLSDSTLEQFNEYVKINLDKHIQKYHQRSPLLICCHFIPVLKQLYNILKQQSQYSQHHYGNLVNKTKTETLPLVHSIQAIKQGGNRTDCPVCNKMITRLPISSTPPPLEPSPHHHLLEKITPFIAEGVTISYLPHPTYSWFWLWYLEFIESVLAQYPLHSRDQIINLLPPVGDCITAYTRTKFSKDAYDKHFNRWLSDYMLKPSAKSYDLRKHLMAYVADKEGISLTTLEEAFTEMTGIGISKTTASLIMRSMGIKKVSKTIAVALRAHILPAFALKRYWFGEKTYTIFTQEGLNTSMAASNDESYIIIGYKEDRGIYVDLETYTPLGVFVPKNEKKIAHTGKRAAINGTIHSIAHFPVIECPWLFPHIDLFISVGFICENKAVNTYQGEGANKTITSSYTNCTDRDDTPDLPLTQSTQTTTQTTATVRRKNYVDGIKVTVSTRSSSRLVEKALTSTGTPTTTTKDSETPTNSQKRPCRRPPCGFDKTIFEFIITTPTTTTATATATTKAATMATKPTHHANCKLIEQLIKNNASTLYIQSNNDGYEPRPPFLFLQTECWRPLPPQHPNEFPIGHPLHYYHPRTNNQEMYSQIVTDEIEKQLNSHLNPSTPLVRPIDKRSRFQLVIDSYRSWVACYFWRCARVFQNLVPNFLAQNATPEEQAKIVAFTSGCRGLLPGVGAVPYHLGPGLNGEDKDYHKNHNSDSTCAYFELLAFKYVIYSLMTNKTHFMIQADHASYHLRRWYNWIELPDDPKIGKWERRTKPDGTMLFPGANPKYQIETKGASRNNLLAWLHACGVTVGDFQQMVSMSNMRKKQLADKSDKDEANEIDIYDQDMDSSLDGKVEYVRRPSRKSTPTTTNVSFSDSLLERPDTPLFVKNSEGKISPVPGVGTKINNKCELSALANHINRRRRPRLRINVAMKYIVYFINLELEKRGFQTLPKLDFTFYWTPEGHFLMAVIENTWGYKRYFRHNLFDGVQTPSEYMKIGMNIFSSISPITQLKNFLSVAGIVAFYNERDSRIDPGRIKKSQLVDYVKPEHRKCARGRPEKASRSFKNISMDDDSASHNLASNWSTNRELEDFDEKLQDKIGDNEGSLPLVCSLMMNVHNDDYDYDNRSNEDDDDVKRGDDDDDDNHDDNDDEGSDGDGDNNDSDNGESFNGLYTQSIAEGDMIDVDHESFYPANGDFFTD